MMRAFLTVLVSGLFALALTVGSVAGHKDGGDDNGLGKAGAPGQQAKAEGAEDQNDDGKVNGKDFAPGQNK